MDTVTRSSVRAVPAALSGQTASPKATRSLAVRSLSPAVFACSLVPLGKLARDAYLGHLTANPIAEALNRLGFWALFFLVLSLAISPMKTLFGFTQPMRVRRMIGLFSFFYATLHFATYLGLDQALDLRDVARDIVQRKFITVGLLAFVLLLPLAITSTDRFVKRLGFRRWKRLHRLAYVAAVLGVVHFVWRVKADLLAPAIFAAVLMGLFVVRVAAAKGGKTGKGARRTSAPSPSAARPPITRG